MHTRRGTVSTFFLDFLLACKASYYKRNPSRTNSLPLDCTRWFAGDVVTNPVDAFDFVADSIRNARQQFVGKPHPVSSHAILTFHDAKHDRVFVGPLVAHHANRLHRK